MRRDGRTKRLVRRCKIAAKGATTDRLLRDEDGEHCSPSGLPGRKQRLIGYLGGESRVANDAELSGRAIDVETRLALPRPQWSRFDSVRPPSDHGSFVAQGGTTRHRIVAFLVSVSATRLSYSTRSARPKTFFWESSPRS